jgi:biotin carboxyl carrier protein
MVAVEKALSGDFRKPSSDYGDNSAEEYGEKADNIQLFSYDPSDNPSTENEVQSNGPESSSMFQVLAPMMGTFYRAAPGTPPFVQIGDKVTAGQTLCLIVGSMGMTMEIKAEQGGIVRGIYFENAQRVDGGTTLLILER